MGILVVKSTSKGKFVFIIEKLKNPQYFVVEVFQVSQLIGVNRPAQPIKFQVFTH